MHVRKGYEIVSAELIWPWIQGLRRTGKVQAATRKECLAKERKPGKYNHKIKTQYEEFGEL